MTQPQKRFSLLKIGAGIAGVALAGATYWYVPAADHPQAPLAAAMVVLMAVWWMFEVIPIPVTSLLPLVLLPAFGITDLDTVGADYGRPIIFLFLGGFILALGLQQSGVHKRIALHIVRIVGSQPSRLVLGFMIACAVLSMWISNTAAVMVLMPIGLSVLDATKERSESLAAHQALAVCLMLGIAYAADIGGMATLIGTPPNLVYTEAVSREFPDAPETGFLTWMAIWLPMSVVFLGAGWVMLTRFIFPMPRTSLFEGGSIVADEIKKLGKLRRDEFVAAFIFFLAAFLWMTGSDIRLGETVIQGWRSLLGLEEVKDAAVAVAAAVLLFMIPSADRKGESLVEWNTAVTLPWGILLLFGGGFAISTGFKESGLSEIVGEGFAGLTVTSPLLVIIIVCTLLTFLTELTSNTAMTNLVLPILSKAAVALGMDPRILMVPATISASCAFMMPIASPTQAIVFGSGHVKISQMVRAGIWFNILGIIMVTGAFMHLGGWLMDIDWNRVPEWAAPQGEQVAVE
ncbi:MAG: SLC13 family permease [Planctomycetota bacterium]